MAGIGWSVVNPALGKAIMDLFPAHERGIAMGIKQMGLTLGGFALGPRAASVAAALGWRAAIADLRRRSWRCRWRSTWRPLGTARHGAPRQVVERPR